MDVKLAWLFIPSLTQRIGTVSFVMLQFLAFFALKVWGDKSTKAV
jgi:hypothetical protein